MVYYYIVFVRLRPTLPPLTWLLLPWLLSLQLLLSLILHVARVQSDRHGGLHNIGAAREREREMRDEHQPLYKSDLAGSSSVGLAALCLDSFLGTLFLLATTAVADTELDFFLGAALAPAEPVPPGHYNGIL